MNRTIFSFLAGAGMLCSGVTVQAQDLITIGSNCTGFDCIVGESFGSDTLRLKENNLRIHFDDTSNSASFPANDWRIIANDSENGGGNYLAIQDATAGRIPFRVEAGVRDNQLYIADNNKIGIGTSVPVTDLHVTQGNTPTLRLEQDGSSGFAAQTWDLAGNESSFFIRDATNGSTLPFRIIPGAASNSLVIDDDEDIGIGAGTNPQAPLHVQRTNSASILVENTTVTADARTLFKLQNAGNTKFEIEEIGSGEIWAFTNNGTDFRISRQGSGAIELLLDNSGNLTIEGSLTQGSDRGSKQGIEPVNPSEMLDKVLGLPVSRWQYRDTPGVDHIGPMAQDFHAAFGVGATDKGISTLDTSGVAFAAIQALAALDAARSAELEALREELRQLRGVNRALDTRLVELEQDRERLETLEVMVRNLLPQAAPVLTAEVGD